MTYTSIRSDFEPHQKQKPTKKKPQQNQKKKQKTPKQQQKKESGDIRGRVNRS